MKFGYGNHKVFVSLQNLSLFCHMRFFWCIGHSLSHQLNTVIHTERN